MRRHRVGADDANRMPGRNCAGILCPPWSSENARSSELTSDLKMKMRMDRLSAGIGPLRYTKSEMLDATAPTIFLLDGPGTAPPQDRSIHSANKSAAGGFFCCGGACSYLDQLISLVAPLETSSCRR